jgi:hypothetical protein
MRRREFLSLAGGAPLAGQMASVLVHEHVLVDFVGADQIRPGFARRPNRVNGSGDPASASEATALPVPAKRGATAPACVVVLLRHRHYSGAALAPTCAALATWSTGPAAAVSSRLPSTRHRSMNVIAMNFQPGALFKKSVTDCQRIGAPAVDALGSRPPHSNVAAAFPLLVLRLHQRSRKPVEVE